MGAIGPLQLLECWSSLLLESADAFEEVCAAGGSREANRFHLKVIGEAVLGGRIHELLDVFDSRAWELDQLLRKGVGRTLQLIIRNRLINHPYFERPPGRSPIARNQNLLGLPGANKPLKVIGEPAIRREAHLNVSRDEGRRFRCDNKVRGQGQPHAAAADEPTNA